LSHSLLHLHTFVYLPATDVQPSTTPQQTSEAGSPNITAIATSTSTAPLSTSTSGRSKVFCYCFGSAWMHFGFLNSLQKLATLRLPLIRQCHSWKIE